MFFCFVSDTTLTRMQLLRVLLSATVLVAPTLAIQQAEGGITCSIKHCLLGEIYPRIQQCSIDHSSSRKIKKTSPANFVTCTICEAVMTAIDQSIVDPTNEQVPSFSFHSAYIQPIKKAPFVGLSKKTKWNSISGGGRLPWSGDQSLRERSRGFNKRTGLQLSRRPT